MKVVLTIVSWLALSSVAIAAENVEIRINRNGVEETHKVSVPSARADVIVEFNSIPTALRAPGTVSVRETDDLFARFRRDLKEIEQPRNVLAKTVIEPTIRREYRTLLVGTAVTVSRTSLEQLRALPYVRGVHEERLLHACADGVVTAVESAAARINAASLPTRGKGVVVAVIDSGIDYKHPALGGGFGPGFKVAGGYDFVNDDADPMDDEGHGTHVAGIIGADSPELTGVAPEATLFAYKVLDHDGRGEDSVVLAGIERAVDPNGDGDPSDHVDVINMSLGGPGDAEDILSRAVDNAVTAGVIVCVAAGNDRTTMSVGSPAASRTAITVGASDASNHVAYFSSKGPTRREFAFKPDVIAPGDRIVSAKLGGGTIAESGTSMATPHVAGAAALLKALHPDWTPAFVKSAVAGSAKPVADETPWACGAGAIDVATAANASLFVSESGLSLGLDSAKGGTWGQSRTVTVTNGSSQQQVIAVKTSTSPQALQLAVTPSTLTLGPGESGQLSISANVNNDLLGYPTSLSAFGTITLTGSTSVAMPWALLRATHATFLYNAGTYETFEVHVNGRSPNFFIVGAAPGESSVDVIAPAGTYELELDAFSSSTATQPTPDTRRFLVRSDVQFEGEQTFDFNTIPQHKIEFVAQDDRGQRLSELPVDGFRRRYLTAGNIRYFKRQPGSIVESNSTFMYGELRNIYVSDASSLYSLQLAETYVDLRNRRVYVAQHPQISFGAHEPLVVVPSDYLTATVKPLAAASQRDVAGCVSVITTGPTSGCFEDAAPSGDGSMQIFVTADKSTTMFTGASIIAAGTVMPQMRAVGSSIVPNDFPSASDFVPTIANHAEITLGIGPVVPFCLSGANCLGQTRRGFLGPWGDSHIYAEPTATYRVLDENGIMAASGRPSVPSETDPVLKPGYRVDMFAPSLRAGNRTMAGELNVKLGTNENDLVPPAISSVSLRGANGAITDRIANGEAAKLVFTAADFHYTSAFGNHGGPRQVRSEVKGGPNVSYRVHGQTQWHALQLNKTGADNESIDVSKHLPLGYGYEADLTAAAQNANSLVDLQFVLTDDSDNEFRWTEDGAFTVGEPPPLPAGPRRRVTSH